MDSDCSRWLWFILEGLLFKNLLQRQLGTIHRRLSENKDRSEEMLI